MSPNARLSPRCTSETWGRSKSRRMAGLHADLLRCAPANPATGPGINDGRTMSSRTGEKPRPTPVLCGGCHGSARMRRSAHLMAANASLERERNPQDRLGFASCDSRWAEYMPALTASPRLSLSRSLDYRVCAHHLCLCTYIARPPDARARQCPRPAEEFPVRANHSSVPFYSEVRAQRRGSAGAKERALGLFLGGPGRQLVPRRKLARGGAHAFQHVQSRGGISPVRYGGGVRSCDGRE